MPREYLDRKEKADSQAFLDVTPYVFVYGTLKRAYSNNTLLTHAEFIGEDTTKDKWLLGQTGIPYAFPSAVVPEEYKHLLRPIRGEVYRIYDLATPLWLDSLEGYHPDKDHAFYWRRVVETQEHDKSCWIYTIENFSKATRCEAPELTDKGEWIWSRKSTRPL